MPKIQAEITLLDQEDLFLIHYHKDAKFDYPMHFHSDYEINLVITPNGGKRLVGDSVAMFSTIDLVFIGANLPHSWESSTQKDNVVYNIKFSNNFFNQYIVDTRLFSPIKEMLSKSERGILFDEKTAREVLKKMDIIKTKTKFDLVIHFLDLLNYMAESQNISYLSSLNYGQNSIKKDSRSRRISKICEFIEENYAQPISLTDIGNLVNMSDSAVSHFFKKRTNRNFITYLNDIRLGKAAKMLGETTKSITDIAYECGFVNLSHFNLMFKKNKLQTPSNYRSIVQKAITKY